ncbi:hypothetical protein [Pseudomonas sp. PB3P13]
MKSQLLLSIALSVLAANASAAASPSAIAEGGADRLIESRIAADGADRLKANQIAEGGSDRLQQNRVALSPANAEIDGALVADVRAEFGSKYQRY